MELFDPRRDDRIGHGGTFNANPLTMAAGLATLDELTPERYDALEALAQELEEGVNARTGASATAVGSLFRIELPDPSRLPDLHVDLLVSGILMTPRGMGCLSTPMASAEVDAFVGALVSAAP
jgi:glutamate-1-semialdehyde 2,1-aminomutase